MTPTDEQTLARYRVILSALTGNPPPAASSAPLPGSAPASQRPIHAALTDYFTACVEHSPDQPSPLIAGVNNFDPPFTAAQGDLIAAAALRAVAQVTLVPSARQPNALLQSLVRHQQPDGRFLASTGRDNPETHWYHELIILHALGAYALRRGDSSAQQAVNRAALLHLNETQPDHATAEPWGLFIFVRNMQTLPLADHLIHCTQVQHPHGPDRHSWMLLRDALYCLNYTAHHG